MTEVGTLQGKGLSRALPLAYLPMEECPIGGTLREEEHVDKVNEDAGGRGGPVGPDLQPLVDNEEHEVAEEAQQEDELRQCLQQKPVGLAKVPVEMDGSAHSGPRRILPAPIGSPGLTCG